MKYLSVCSGIEAASVAWEPLGWEPVAFSEIEAFPSAVLAHHFPHVPNLGDMTKHETWNLKPGSIDLLVGGTPCQSFSLAGLRKGLHDPRGGLMLRFVEIARRLRPRWVVWENVPGVLSSSGGRDFGSFLGALEQLGYGWAYRVMDAQYVRTLGHPRAVPQRRRRVFVVGCAGDAGAAAAVLLERESVLRNTSTRRKAREGASADVAGSLGTRIGSDLDGHGAYIPEVVGTLSDGAHMGGGLNGQDAYTGRIIAPYGTGGGNVPLVIPIQDSRVIEKNQNGIGVGNETSPAYTIDQTGAQAVAIQQNTRGDVYDDGSSPTVRVGSALGITDGYSVGVVTMVNMQGGKSGAYTSTDGSSYTLNAMHGQHAVAVAPTIAATNDPSRSPQSSEITQQVAAVHASTMQVRRLTPRECERLQGFPDDWTAIPWRGKPASDGPRYRAIGNSMAVNCMEWIGQRIADVEART